MKGTNSEKVIIVLVALAVVVAISGGGIYFGARTAEKEAKRLRSQLLGTSLVSALRNYSAEYRRFPVTLIGSPGEFKGLVDQALLSALTGTDTKANPRGIMFLGSSKIEGLTRTAGVWDCRDAWGGEYEVHIWAPDAKEPFNFNITATSKGPDGIFGTPDDIVSGR